MNATDFSAIVSVICAILTVFLFPCLGYIYKQARKNKKRVDLVDSLPKQLEKIEQGVSETKLEVKEIKEIQNHSKEKFDKLETQQLKYIINNAFYSCDGHLEELSYEMLINAVECAQIYIDKGLNHETGARCEKLFKEVERRAIQVEEDDE